ncbi:D-alanyl-D-alanine carboxypeptidase/D-alanyl-D-alanine-endopeptidase [bacterium]|nr:D-alanyl-D-alanine carboxypeptidase/D-alanyl-D-alanine-endopeptidase [bacterium]
MRFGLSTFFFLVTILPSLRGEEAQLLPAVAEIINRPEFKQSQWGILLADRETGEVLQSYGPQKLYVPASTTKLFSSAAALEVLGPDHRFKTPVFKRGTLEGDGSLKGDLVLVASGDPTMGGRTTEAGEIAFTDADHTYEGQAILTKPDPLAGLDALAKQVAASGIRFVDGEVFVDTRLFDPGESTGSGPRHVNAITINDNVIDIVVRPKKDGEPAEVTWRPKSARISVDASVKTVSRDAKDRIHVHRTPSGGIVVRGEIRVAPENEPAKPQVRIVEIDDPASFARGLFIEALNRAGVKTKASALDANPSVDEIPRSLPEADRVAVLESPPFSENIRLILKVSHNLHASELPILVGLAAGKPTIEGGLRKEHDVLASLGVDVESISFGGGAGGSPADLVTPEAAVALLRGMTKHKSFAAYERALPVLGVDGTLADAVEKGSPAVGRVRAKTGTYWWQDSLNDRRILTSKALAGYIKSSKDRNLVFALYVNYVHLSTTEERQKVGKLLGKICEHWVQSY